MTNSTIIFWESMALMEKGLIGTTGREIVMQDKDGNTRTYKEPEPIHTFAFWKAHGYKVRKGEHAVAKFAIWKGAERPMKDENGNALDETELKMFMKVSCFFSGAQVEPMTEKA